MGRVVSMSSYKIAEVLEKVMKKVLPIPKKPKIYRGPRPAKPHLSWIPRGDKDNPKTLEKLRHFAGIMKDMDSKRGKILDKVSSRGWCYIFEGLNLITKGDFKLFEKAINNCRKKGYLPIDYVATDQDRTRQFADLHEALSAATPLQALKKNTKKVIKNLPHLITDYWQGEEYYLMMCVEKIDLRNLFRPICKQFNIPIMNMGGWYTIQPRESIIKLCKEVEKKGLIPVLLLFYDHDIAGLKMSEIFRKGLNDLHGATKWDSSNLIIDRFGLNKEDVDKYNLMWIDNLKSGSGRDPDYRRKDVQEYIRKFGERKCESNTLLRNEETLRIGQNLCIQAIWKYYGKNVIDRFKELKEESKSRLKEVYANPIWEQFEENIDDLIKTYTKPPMKVDEIELEIGEEKVYEVEIDNKYYQSCPECYRQFDYDQSYINRLVRCRNPNCRALMKLKKAANWK